VKLHQIKISPAGGVSDVVFEERDQSLAVVSPEGFVGRWMLPTYSVIKEGVPEKNMEYRSLDYISDVNEEHLLVVAGTNGFKSNIRLINQRDNIVKNYCPEEGKFT